MNLTVEPPKQLYLKHKMPKIEINLSKIAHNARMLKSMYQSKGIHIMGVTKGVCGSLEIANLLVDQGISQLGDSKIENLKRMKEAGVQAEFVLLRTPALSEIEAVVDYADISLNSELEVIQRLSECALEKNTVHKIILMIELGDLREGVMPDQLDRYIQSILQLRGIEVVGVGANFACFGGVKPDAKKMNTLSHLASEIRNRYHLSLPFISGGNSANYNWFTSTEQMGEINQLRIGESILLGQETLSRTPIPGLYTDAFTFYSEVIESKIKPSVPYGEIAQNALGFYPEFEEKGNIRHAILGVGIQDVLVGGLTSLLDVNIIGFSSDHTVLDAKKVDLQVGDAVAFNLNYGALLSLMTSSTVSKEYV
ncbi:alanine/ornithine racemase family PLP-dependent enzyme [Halalkalibacillus halophilus]|uniref:alanine/ornithine racemase family PLP-dependent enzyme n=1 Tax=Halalkalibacillus halophilus TaxID=392827 RepID=UPI000412895C|nr:alanine/ornithine racemase family PLP-dependent enzyme [Halalkalibacillus halophilus]